MITPSPSMHYPYRRDTRSELADIAWIYGRGAIVLGALTVSG